MSATASTVTSADAASRARFMDPENFFAFKWPTVPRRQFLAERDRAFARDAPTGEIALDASDAMGMAYAATTPLLLARYLVVQQATPLEITRNASAELFYVFQGAGVSEGCGESIHWKTGDVFCFPGGTPVRHTANQSAVLFTVCNEPLLRLEHLQPPPPGTGIVQPVHWTDEALGEHFEAVFSRPDTAQTAGRALQLSSAQMEPAGYPVPTMNVAINTLEPGGDQRPHRHNGAAITLSIQGEGVYSMIEEQKVPWSHGAAQVTPATELHSHHNRGTARMRSLVVQDEGLHFYTRTPRLQLDLTAVSTERDAVVALLDAYIRAFETGTREDLQAFCLQPVGYVTDDEVQLRQRYPFDPVILRERTGLHSSDMSINVLHIDGHRAHVALEGARKREDGSVIENLQALYILNKVDGAWKISLISGIRIDPM